LVYCKPAATRELNAALLSAPEKRPYRPGEKVDLHVQSPNAKDALVLAAVLDEKWEQAGAAPGVGNPNAYFLLTTEVEQPEDLENAEVVLGAGPKGEKALDLFLCTQGWRRFTQSEATAELLYLVRGRPLPRAVLGGACAALLLSAVTHFATGELRGGGRVEEPHLFALLTRGAMRSENPPEAPAERRDALAELGAVRKL